MPPNIIYDTAELIIVQQHLPNLPDGFWTNLATRTITSDREEILFEKADIDNRKLAPFVAPNVQGRVMRGQGFSQQSFRPAYTKPKHIVDPTKAMARMMGEPILGGMSLAARFDAAIVNNLRLEREMIQRRWDWMACRAVVDGAVTVAGEDYSSVTVDFGRSAALSIQLTSTARWSQSGTAAPLVDLGAAVDSAFSLGNGPITDFVFGTTAWSNYIKNADVKDLLSTQKRGSDSNFSVIPLTQRANYQPMGQIITPSGSFNLWRYSNYYSDVDSNGVLTTKQYLDPTVVVGYGPMLDLAGMFGAIMDRRSLNAIDMFPKMWDNEDPSITYTMTQSAPLWVPFNPNNSFKIITE